MAQYSTKREAAEEAGSMRLTLSCWLAASVLALALIVCRNHAALASGESWQVVLAAGDDAEPVFDDATKAST